MLILIAVIFFVLLIMGMPIAFCMAISAAFAILFNPSLPATAIAQKIYTAVDSISFITIPPVHDGRFADELHGNNRQDNQIL